MIVFVFYLKYYILKLYFLFILSIFVDEDFHEIKETLEKNLGAGNLEYSVRKRSRDISSSRLVSSCKPNMYVNKVKNL